MANTRSTTPLTTADATEESTWAAVVTAPVTPWKKTLVSLAKTLSQSIPLRAWEVLSENRPELVSSAARRSRAAGTSASSV